MLGHHLVRSMRFHGCGICAAASPGRTSGADGAPRSTCRSTKEREDLGSSRSIRLCPPSKQISNSARCSARLRAPPPVGAACAATRIAWRRSRSSTRSPHACKWPASLTLPVSCLQTRSSSELSTLLILCTYAPRELTCALSSQATRVVRSRAPQLDRRDVPAGDAASGPRCARRVGGAVARGGELLDQRAGTVPPRHAHR